MAFGRREQHALFASPRARIGGEAEPVEPANVIGRGVGLGGAGTTSVSATAGCSAR